MSDDHLAINTKNRHQYFETVVYNGSSSERKIMQAEARGRARMARERTIKRRIVIGLVLLLVMAGGAAAWYVLR